MSHDVSNTWLEEALLNRLLLAGAGSAQATRTSAQSFSHCVEARMKWVRTMQQCIDVKVYGNCGPLKCSTQEECFAELRMQEHSTLPLKIHSVKIT